MKFKNFIETSRNFFSSFKYVLFVWFNLATVLKLAIVKGLISYQMFAEQISNCIDGLNLLTQNGTI